VLRRRHLGRITFAEANDFQRALVRSSDDYILLFEHPPTYTMGIRTQAEHFLVPPRPWTRWSSTPTVAAT